MKYVIMLLMLSSVCNSSFAQGGPGGGSSGCPGGFFGLTCAVKSDTTCAALHPNVVTRNCDIMYTTCVNNAGCSTAPSSEVLYGDRSVDAHRLAFAGESGNDRLCFTGQNTVCVISQPCSTCQLVQGMSLIQKYCQTNGASWTNTNQYAKFTMSGSCSGTEQ